MTGIGFATPELLLLLPVALALALMPLYIRRRARPATVMFANTGAVRPSAKSWRLRIRPFVPVLKWVGFALLIIAAARPQTSDAREIVRGEGVDIALALDISGSMSRLDFAPRNRLEAAKKVIAEFIERRAHDRIGLVVFASNVFVSSPLTVDHNALNAQLEQIDLAANLGVMDGTALGMGLATAANMLESSDAESRIVVLMTDGVNNAGDIDPITAAVAAEATGVRVYTVGMGEANSTTDAQQQSRQFRRSSTDLDEETLEDIADRTGGRYFLATNTASLREIYDEIDSLEKSEFDVSVFVEQGELAGWLLGPALLLLFAEMMIGGTLLRSAP